MLAGAWYVETMAEIQFIGYRWDENQSCFTSSTIGTLTVKRLYRHIESESQEKHQQTRWMIRAYPMLLPLSFISPRWYAHRLASKFTHPTMDAVVR